MASKGLTLMISVLRVNKQADQVTIGGVRVVPVYTILHHWHVSVAKVSSYIINIELLMSATSSRFLLTGLV